MIYLCHGSNVSIDKIELKRSRKGKDFGCGFYLNPDRQQAMDMAVRTTRRMIEELRFNKPAIQYFFGTEKAVALLTKIQL